MARSFSLQSISIQDSPSIGKIGHDSFKSDRHTMMKSQGNYNHNNTAQEPIGRYLSLPEKVQGIKAVDNLLGKTIGYVFWGFRGYTRMDVPTLTGRGVGDEVVGDALPVARADDGTDAGEDNEAGDNSDDPIKRLTAITDADMQRWMGILMPEGTKCMFIVSLSVDQAYASQGVGSALMDWGTTHADKDGVFCWVHSSESGQRFYAKHGFKEVGSLEVDLDEYAPAPAPDCNGEWGHYTFKYMKRLPRS